MSVNIKEQLVGFGFRKQSAIDVANVAAGMWRLNKLNSDFAGPRLITENDAAELGKGHEFATQLFKSHWDVGGRLEKYCSAEFAAWVMAFGLGHVVKSGTTPNWIYTCTPLDKVADGIELPYWSYLEQVRPGASVVLDRVAHGCAINSWLLEIMTGPGRANSKLSVEFIGSGKHTEPSTITMPSATAEKLLPASSAAITINGVDYVTPKNFVSLRASGNNNIDPNSGFYPGSGFQDAGDATSGAVRGRLEVGDREFGLQFVARFKNGSTELTKVKALTEGTGVVGLTYDANNSLTLTYQRLTFAVAELGETNGIMTVQVTCLPMMHTSNGILTAVAECNVDGIAQAEV